jgi:hypothetical protein
MITSLPQTLPFSADHADLTKQLFCIICIFAVWCIAFSVHIIRVSVIDIKYCVAAEEILGRIQHMLHLHL